MEPTVSVVMSVYNGGEDLAPAIDSVLAQTFTDFEFVIINDGSKDNSLELLRQYEARDARIRVIDQANTGLTVALQRGVAASRGEFIARMDADDVSLPTRLEKEVALLRSDPKLAIVSCHLEHFYDDGTVKLIQTFDFNPRLTALFACFYNPIGGHGQILYRRTAYEAAGGYDPDYNLAEDYDLWTRILRQGELGIVPETLYRYRVGHESVTSRNKPAQEAVTRRVIRRECERVTGEAMDEAVAQAMLEFWWGRKPERTPIRDAGRLNAAMNAVVDRYFAQAPDLAALEPEARKIIANSWRWRSAKVRPADIARRALYLANAASWRLKA